MIKCSKCGKENIDGAIFCADCGTKLDNAMSSICPSCNSVVVHDTDNWVLSKKQMLRQTRR